MREPIFQYLVNAQNFEKDLQALGVLTLEEDPEMLTPWPPRTEEWAACFPIAKAAPVNTCPPT